MYITISDVKVSEPIDDVKTCKKKELTHWWIITWKVKLVDSINKKIPVVIVENSSDQNFKKNLENKYLNVKCFLTNDNLGFANANNFGLNLIDTKYIFLLNPDVVLQSNTLDILIDSAQKIKDFALLAPQASNDPNYGFFNKKKTA